MPRPLHRVTCKVALYDRAKHKVLLVEYNKDDFGLPGGHLELGEEPEASMRRELLEELGIAYNLPLIRKDFWVHPDGKVILGFVGELDSATKLIREQKELRSIKWVDVEDIKTYKITAGCYDRFILNN